MSYEICILQEVNHLMLLIIVFGHSSVVFGVLRPRKGSREWYKAMDDLREGPRVYSLRVYGLKAIHWEFTAVSPLGLAVNSCGVPKCMFKALYHFLNLVVCVLDQEGRIKHHML